MVAAFFGCSCFLACFGAERRILAGRECGMRYQPALRPCFARHFGPGPRM